MAKLIEAYIALSVINFRTNRDKRTRIFLRYLQFFHNLIMNLVGFYHLASQQQEHYRYLYTLLAFSLLGYCWFC